MERKNNKAFLTPSAAAVCLLKKSPLNAGVVPPETSRNKVGCDAGSGQTEPPYPPLTESCFWKSIQDDTLVSCSSPIGHVDRKYQKCVTSPSGLMDKALAS